MAALLCLVSIGVWGQTTVEMSTFTETNSDNIGGDANVSYATAKGGGTAAPAINNNQIRLYQNANGDGGGTITISAKEGYILQKVVIGSDMDTQIAYTKDAETTKSATEALAKGGKCTVDGLDNSSITFYCMGTTSKARLYVNYLSVTYSSAAAPTQVSAPVFTPPTGETFTEQLNVKLASSTEGANIYYTTDGVTDPTAASTLYTEAGIDLTATTTIKAIAIDPTGTLTASKVVEATYTKVEPLADFAALRNAIVDDNITSSGSAKEYIVKFTDAVVTKVSGSIAFLQEGENGFYYYASGHGYNEGDVLNGTVTVKGFMYNGWPELTSIEGATVTAGGVYAPVEVTLAELAANYDKYESRLVKVVAAEVTNEFANRNGEITQAGTAMALRAADASITATMGTTVDVIGVLGKYNTTVQLNVYRQDDITLSESSKQEGTLTFEQDVYEVNFEGEVTVKAVSNNTNATVTYSKDASVSDDVLKLDDKTGQVLVGSVAGTYTITATVAEDDNYTAATATCTVKVKDPNMTTVEVEDVITADNIEYVDGTGYRVFNYLGTAADGIDYSGVALPGTSGNAGMIQLNTPTASSHRGVFVTKNDNGYSLKKIIIDWGTTETGRDITLYGRNEAYTVGTDDPKTNATECGTAVCGTSTEIIPSGKFKYYALQTTKSSSAAIYVKSFTFVWEKEVPATVDVAVSSVGYATFSSSYDVDFTNSEIEAYTATLDETDPENVKVSFARTMKVAAGEGVLIHAEGGANAKVPTTSAVAKAEGNVLVGELAGIESQPSEDADYKYYILNNGAKGLGFYAANNQAVGAGKAYLKIGKAQAAKLSFVGLDGVVNGIGEISTDAAADGIYHSLSGVRTSSPAKGLYIKNGKKVIVK